MTYIPKSKIKTNLYTRGNEFVYFNEKTFYIGYYHKLYNGKYFTGENPNSLNKREIIPIFDTIDKKTLISNIIPEYNPILPTENDYKKGEFIRYFSVKRNQPIYNEIDKNTYDKFKNQNKQTSWKLYKVFFIYWKLTGDIENVLNINKNNVEITEYNENIIGLGLYLKENWIQYYKKI